MRGRLLPPPWVGHELFELGDAAVPELARGREVPAALQPVQAGPRLFELGLGLLHLVELGALPPPVRAQLPELDLRRLDRLLDLAAALRRARVGLFLERLELDLLHHDLPLQLPNGLGLGLLLHLESRRRLVDEVNGLVGHPALREVPLGKRGRGDERIVLDRHAVVELIPFFKPAQNADRVLNVWLLDEHRLEAPGQGGVLLYVLAILVQGGGPHAPQLTARESRFQNVCGAHGTVPTAGAHQHV
mmetsp:Transcript_20606/g.46483  ORF Transcript_20606/g.46483 Transcript_20606/m.46483 type:complete len:246 (-) Transcript_20606:590-1327(-)